MKFSYIRATLGGIKNNWRGWSTNRKIVVFESDDWGSIRMPSKDIYRHLVKKGFPIENRPQEKFDALESEVDLEKLFEKLLLFKDKNGRNPVFTANTIMTNPDFGKIENSGFTSYHFELFPETYRRYPKHDKCFQLLKEGIRQGIFYPQYHGNEHINIERWMNELREVHSETRAVFSFGMSGVTSKKTPDKGNKLMIAYDYDHEGQKKRQISSLQNGVKYFKQLFGFTPKSFIAPVYTWHSDVERALKIHNIEYIQGGKKQILPSKLTISHFLGEKNQLGQTYLVRNVFFEPSLFLNDIVGNTMRYINSAFLMNKPAIISTHRINYIGFIDEKNREQGLNKLGELLSRMLKKWPDIEFMTSEELGDLIK